MTILAHFDLSALEKKNTGAPNPWAGRDSQGYGRKIPTKWMVKLPKSFYTTTMMAVLKTNLPPRRWLRVYVCCISNSGTSYVLVKKNWVCIDG